MIKTILFDLDGTLLDTAPDLAWALNQTRQEQGLNDLPYETIRPAVSHGGQALIELGFKISVEDDSYNHLYKRLLEIYQENLANKTRLFPGMEKVLQFIEGQQLQWGIVTNKPAWLTDPLLEQLDLLTRSCTTISGDTTPNRKPHPEPMLLACRQSQSNPEECLYVGDAQRDIEAGKRAGMTTLLALYGYILPGDQPELWGADASLDKPEDLINWLQNSGICL